MWFLVEVHLNREKISKQGPGRKVLAYVERRTPHRQKRYIIYHRWKSHRSSKFESPQGRRSKILIKVKTLKKTVGKRESYLNENVYFSWKNLELNDV